MSRKYNDTACAIVGRDGNKIITQTVQDCEGTIKEAKRDRDQFGGKGSMGYHAAKIPRVLLHQWGLEDCPPNPLCYLQGKHNKDPELAKKLAIRLNSNEFNMFRIWEGTVASSDILKE